MRIQRKFISLSYLEGFFYAIMVSSSESYALFFSVKKGFSQMGVALASTLPLLLGALCQWLLPQFIKGRYQGRCVALLQSFQLIGLSGLLYCVLNSFPFVPFITSLCLYWIGSLTCGPIWIDWMSHQLPRSTFRNFLARRNSFVVMTTLTFYLGIAYIYDHFPGLPPAAIFITGIVARSCSILAQVSILLLIRNKVVFLHRKTIPQTSDNVVELDAIKKVLLVAFFWTGLFKMAVSLSSPFFLPYMVNELKFSLWDYTLLMAMPMLGRSLFLRSWGLASEGMRPFIGLQISGLFISFIPLLWSFASSFQGTFLHTFTAQYPYLIGVEFSSGVFWAGFELSAILIIQNLVRNGSAKMHGLHMAIMNAFSIIGSYFGAVLLQEKYSYEFVFWTSSCLRFLVISLFIIHISKWQITRFRPKIYGDFLISVLTLRSTVRLGRLVFPTHSEPPALKKQHQEILPDQLANNENSQQKKVTKEIP